MPHITNSGLVILYEKQGGKCCYCGCSLLDVAKDGGVRIDHIVPKAAGGSSARKNLCITCSWCNTVKGKRDKEDFLEYIQPYLDGLVSKKELRDYNHYKRLWARFAHIDEESG